MLDTMRERDRFTPTEMQITKYIQENASQVVSMPLDELAEKTFVSKSTIIRFCKKMGFHGHKEMCVQLAKELSSLGDPQQGSKIDPSFPFAHGDDRKVIADKLQELCYKALRDTMQDLPLDKVQHIARIIHDKKSLTIYAPEDNDLSARDFLGKLVSIGINARIVTVSSLSLQAALAQAADSCALFVSYYGNQSFMVQAARVLFDRKITVMLISGPFSSKVEKYAVEAVRVGFYEATPKIGSIGSCVAMTMALNLAYLYLFNLEYDRNMTLVKGQPESPKMSLDGAEGK